MESEATALPTELQPLPANAFSYSLSLSIFAVLPICTYRLFLCLFT